jgi:peptidase M28-like protein
LTRKLSLAAWLLILTSFTFAQTNSFEYPPDQLLAKIRPEGIRADMRFLADDLLEGRGTGSHGYQLAALYIRTQFEQMGLKPAGDNGTYLQSVRLRKIELVRDQSSMKLNYGGSEKTLTMDRDFLMRGDPVSTNTTAQAPLVFVGYGVTAPDFQYDDYVGADVRGKIVVAFYGAPPRLPTAPGAHYSSSDIKLANAAAHGAIGFLAIWGGKQEQRTPFANMTHFFRQASMRWLDATGNPNNAQPRIKGYAWVSTAAIAPVFESAGHPWKDVQAAALDSKPQSFDLSASASIHIVSRHSEVQSSNIAAILPGSDPQLKNEYVVYTAHADHLGIGDPVNGDNIYNGAADNASGTAALLEIARAFSSMPTAPKRSLLFLVVTGEEEGLLGSDFYARNPTVPMSSIVANVNMDEISLLYDFRDIVPLGAEHSSLNSVIEDVAQHMGLEISPDPTPEEVSFVRSDQYSFVKQGVPAIYVGEGQKSVDLKINGAKLADTWEASRYHMPGDDMNQPLDFNAAAKCTRINLAIGYEVAQAKDRPHWKEGDFFKKIAEKASTGR